MQKEVSMEKSDLVRANLERAAKLPGLPLADSF